MKLTDEQNKTAKEARDKIARLSEEQETIFVEILEKVKKEGLPEQTGYADSEDILFDYCFNSFGDSAELTLEEYFQKFEQPNDES